MQTLGEDNGLDPLQIWLLQREEDSPWNGIAEVKTGGGQGNFDESKKGGPSARESCASVEARFGSCSACS